MNRRTFLQTATGGVTSMASLSWSCAVAAEQTNWPIGCFNRAWTKWSYHDALAGIKAAGYQLTGLLSAHQSEAFTSSAATPEYLDALKKRIARHGLAVNMTAIRFKPDGALADNIADLRKQIDSRRASRRTAGKPARLPDQISGHVMPNHAPPTANSNSWRGPRTCLYLLRIDLPQVREKPSE